MPNRGKQNNNNNKRKSLRQDLKNIGKGALSQLTPIITSTITKVVPALITKMIGGAMGVPFNTSGMNALAIPSGRGNGMQVSMPAANGKVTTSGGPRTRSYPNGNSTVSHREYVADIAVGETGFDLQYQYGINPGNGALFPWLSTIAQRYEMYKFRQLRFIYEPQCGSTSTGTIMLAVDYDASDSPPTSKSQMMSYKRAVRSPLWFACEHDSASADLHRLKTNFVLSGVAPPDSDIKTYDIGNLFVAIESDGGDQSAGELYVEYVVDLLTPQINNDPPSFSAYIQNGTYDANENNPFTSAVITKGPTFNGPLPVFLEPSATNPNFEEDVYINTAGFYVVTCRFVTNQTAQQGTQVTIINSQTPLGALEGQATQLSGGQNFTFIYYIVEVVNTDQRAFTLLFSNLTIDTTISTFSMYIAPISTQTIILANGDPYQTKVNPRARLGRIRV